MREKGKEEDENKKGENHTPFNNTIHVGPACFNLACSARVEGGLRFEAFGSLVHNPLALDGLMGKDTLNS